MATPVIATPLALLGVDFSRKHSPTDDGNTQLDELGDVCLEDRRAVSNGVRITRVTLRNHLRVSQRLVLCNAPPRLTVYNLADHVAVAFSIKLGEVCRAIAYQGRWDVKADIQRKL